MQPTKDSLFLEKVDESIIIQSNMMSLNPPLSMKIIPLETY